MPKNISIKDLSNTSKEFDTSYDAEETPFVGEKGSGDMVIMSIENCENTINTTNMYKEIELSESQIIEGKIKNARESINAIRNKYGL